MNDLEHLMSDLDGADAETVNRIAWQKGSLPVRLAMLGLAAKRKGDSPLWWGYPPGVFIGYKWDGEPMHQRVQGLAEHVRGLGYQVFLDVENLNADADAYFQIPQFIASLQQCNFYVLLLTERAADLIAARKHKTSWIYDEYQHAVRLANAGRLLIVPVLLEAAGLIDDFPRDHIIDLTADSGGFKALNDILKPGPVALDEAHMHELHGSMMRFDTLFLGQQWDAAATELERAAGLGHTFDHQFRQMLHALYTADGPGFEAAFARLRSVYGQQIVLHLYRGYCSRHGIPVRVS